MIKLNQIVAHIGANIFFFLSSSFELLLLPDPEQFNPPPLKRSTPDSIPLLPQKILKYPSHPQCRVGKTLCGDSCFDQHPHLYSLMIELKQVHFWTKIWLTRKLRYFSLAFTQFALLASL